MKLTNARININCSLFSSIPFGLSGVKLNLQLKLNCILNYNYYLYLSFK